MSTERIDLISNYCDRWCERCAFTSRCSNFALDVAAAMCDGDFEAAMELAIGDPATPEAGPAKPLPDPMSQLLEGFSPTEKELDEIGKQLKARDRRVHAHPLSELAKDYAMAVHRWFTVHGRYENGPDAVVRDSIDVIGWDQHLIAAKLDRALSGKDAFAAGESPEDDAVQNDWNGSAKVALISLDRSSAAWQAVHRAVGDHGSLALAELSACVSVEVRREFPDAMRFIRPGFDGIERPFPWQRE